MVYLYLKYLQLTVQANWQKKKSCTCIQENQIILNWPCRVIDTEYVTEGREVGTQMKKNNGQKSKLPCKESTTMMRMLALCKHHGSLLLDKPRTWIPLESETVFSTLSHVQLIGKFTMLFNVLNRPRIYMHNNLLFWIHFEHILVIFQRYLQNMCYTHFFYYTLSRYGDFQILFSK